MSWNVCMLAALLGVGFAPGEAAATERIPVQEFVRHAQYSATRISPGGRFLALTIILQPNEMHGF